MEIVQGTDMEIVDYLLSAEKERREVVKVTDKYPNLTFEEAYVLQEKLIQKKEQEGARRIGLKLGLTSKAKQQMMGVHEAIYGYLMDNMLALEWEPIDFNQLIHPKAEPEIAFFIGEDLQGTNITAADVLQVTQYVAPAIEVIDSRYLDFKFTLADVIADNCSSARFVVGSKWMSPAGLDLGNLGMIMSKNGELSTVGAGAAVLGHPATSVAWAVNKLGEIGKGLKKGDIVLSGAISEAISFQPGDSILVQFAELGSVSFTCK
ncbi:2-keto-4-pentenoate hydratase [Aneurinibacillus thermoaerophilus]|uniref:2-oxo-3-hexenedioate decarboxylase n=2 Tax=Aneurinibacillus thermoaerophilus TaxID=143495 RepID=A0A1G8DW44_ANETH|nr:fumarylacetoacetate hydrolase family protein [Aneurinibacillus thermoaerophilus]MED0680372.1 fumarylacetoacetate hydrolase family protein [Aneurinibacillus thermoaerophilus]MED0738511.1 fumarylacetoacetate hydrolase family protein [Aneurinibacillus thermoaerophilus]MED0763292.1 fumarylacetoacetate hydrolase family protein [Aneurinibacillus thermoaerophilus]SDH61946.1 2-oxo-3-hexenedioate decarboxylase [Aneurinibacillus thermoaerophilus]